MLRVAPTLALMKSRHRPRDLLRSRRLKAPLPRAPIETGKPQWMGISQNPVPHCTPREKKMRCVYAHPQDFVMFGLVKARTGKTRLS